MPDRVPRRTNSNLCALDNNSPNIKRIGSEDCARHLGSPRANQSGHAKNFAGSHIQLDMVEHSSIRILRIAAPG